MTGPDIALLAAGLIGSLVAVIHGVLTQRLMVAPFATIAATDRRIRPPVRRLVPILLHFSTFMWFGGGIALMAAIWMEPPVRLTICLFVGVGYLFGAIGNLAGVRGLHPGWVLYAVAVALIAYGA